MDATDRQLLMRFSWLSSAVVLLDLLAKLILTNLNVGRQMPLFSGAISLEVLNPGGAAFAHYFETATSVGGWLLIAGLLGLFLVLFRLGRHFLNAFILTNLGLQLAAGGTLVHALDFFLYGAQVPLIQIGVSSGVSVSAGIGDMAIAAGLILLAVDLIRRRRAPTRPRVPLREVHTPDVDLAGLERGIDNVHVDVLLSPRFQEAASNVVYGLVSHHLHSMAKQKSNEPGRRLLKHFAATYGDMAMVAIRKAKTAGQPEQYWLMQLAVIKFLQQEINRSIVAGIQNLSDRLQGRQMLGYRATAEQNERMIWLFRNRNTIYHQVCQRVFTIIANTESTTVSGLRETLLGDEQTVVGQSFSTPLTQAPSADDDYVMMQYYLLMARHSDDPFSFPQLDRLLNRVFADALAGGNRSKSKPEPDQVLNLVRDETAPQRPLHLRSPLMDPENASILLDVDRTRRAMKTAAAQGRRDKAKELRIHLRFQKQAARRLRAALEHEHVMLRLLTAYEVATLFGQYADALSPRALEKLTLHQIAPLHVSQRHRRLQRSGERQIPFSPLLQAAKRVRRRYYGDLSQSLLRFLRDFCAYRRDLYTLYVVQQASNQVHLLEQDTDIETSRINRRLYEFPVSEERTAEASEIGGHAILKADLRGSSAISEELTRRNLNPATHFSLNFFQPINEVIEHFGGEKMFIEGDAVIVQFWESADPRAEHFAVARACGLAAAVLDVINQHNARCHSYGLPPLELGIGIAYNEGAPTYIFDNNHRIIISTAVNRADRLSSSTHSLRRRMERLHGRTQHVMVYAAPRKDDRPPGSLDSDIVYNVNGVVLEPAAFDKLSTEIALKPLSLDISAEGTLYAGRYPDSGGRMHTLVVREATVRRFTDEDHLGTAEPVQERSYFEVIADQDILRASHRAQHGS